MCNEKGDVAFHAAEPEKIFKAVDEFADEEFHDCREMRFAVFSTSFRLTENRFDIPTRVFVWYA